MMTQETDDPGDKHNKIRITNFKPKAKLCPFQGNNCLKCRKELS